MKGVVGTLGMMRLYSVSSEIVLALRAENLSKLDELFELLQQEYDRVGAIF